MHPEAYGWVAQVARDIPPVELAVELGSKDINGSARRLFQVDRWVGVDLQDGPGVDVVADARNYHPECAPDLVLCTEVLEHARWPDEIVQNAHRILAPGGALVLTAASPPRAPHSGVDGWARLLPGEHYANVEPTHLAVWLACFERFTVEQHDERGDVYALAFKAAD